MRKSLMMYSSQPVSSFNCLQEDLAFKAKQREEQKKLEQMKEKAGQRGPLCKLFYLFSFSFALSCILILSQLAVVSRNLERVKRASYIRSCTVILCI
jgi:hypothetical protein